MPKTIYCMFISIYMSIYIYSIMSIYTPTEILYVILRILSAWQGITMPVRVPSQTSLSQQPEQACRAVWNHQGSVFVCLRENTGYTKTTYS